MAAKLTLPQNDPNTASRQAQLSQRQIDYKFTIANGLPIGEQFYDRDGPGLDWMRQLLVSIYRSRSNLEAYLTKSGKKFEKPLPQKSIIELVTMLIKKDTLGLLGYYLPDLGRVADGAGVATSLDDYRAIFQKEPLPPVASVFMDDAVFARGFVAGPNPMLLRRLDAPLAKLAVTDDLFRRMPDFAKDSYHAAISDGRVYVSDYAMLADLAPGNHFEMPKSVGQPIALLAVPKGGRSLLPIAIQLGQDAKTSTVWTPADGWSWQMAKAFVRACDGTYQEVVCHLGWTHLIVEPFVVATRRNLAENHPVYSLLNQHFEGTMPINALAFKTLIVPGGVVDQLVTAKIESIYGLLQRERFNFSFKNRYVPTELRARGIDDKTRLPDHPYRDDAQGVWGATHNWITAYINHYYATDQDVAGDPELRAWASELSDPSKGAIQDLGEGGVLDNKASLVDALTMLIFTGSAQHAAVNFAQKTDMAFCPSYPLGAFDQPVAGATQADFLRTLPPIDLALRSEQTLVFLGSVHYGKLGSYGLTYFSDPAVTVQMLKFQKELASLEATIVDRNETLPLPYIHLQPSLIPQSINI